MHLRDGFEAFLAIGKLDQSHILIGTMVEQLNPFHPAEPLESTAEHLYLAVFAPEG